MGRREKKRLRPKIIIGYVAAPDAPERLRRAFSLILEARSAQRHEPARDSKPKEGGDAE